MKTALAILLAGVALTTLTHAQTQTSARATYEAARKLETVDGDLKKAIDLYLRVADSADASLAEQAHRRLAASYKRLGDVQAEQRHAAQAQALAVRRTGLAASPAQSGSKSPVSSLVKLDEVQLEFMRDVFITPDGRFLSMGTLNGFITRDMRNGRIERWDTYSAAMMSPDGQRVAIVAFNPAEKGYELRVEDRGSRRRPPTVLRANGYSPYLAAWSPDGTRILLRRLNDADLRSELVWWSTVDGSLKPIVPLRRGLGDHPSLSPDGRYIAYTALANPPDRPTRRGGPAAPAGAGVSSFAESIYVIAADGSGQKEVVRGDSNNRSPLWNESGSHILFMSDRSGTLGLYAIAVRNGEAVGKPFPVPGTTLPEQAKPVGVTRSGTFFYVKNAVGPDVFQQELRPDGRLSGAASRLSDNAVNHNSSPAYSPDGTRVAFVRDRDRLPMQLVVQDLKSGSEIGYDVYGGSLGTSTTPAWMPGGDSVIITRRPPASGPGVIGSGNRAQEVVQFDLKTKSAVSLHTQVDRPFTNCLAVSPDGQTIYLGQNDRLVALDVRSRQQRELLKVTSVNSIAVSPDGRSLAIGGVRFLARVNVDGTDYRELFRSPQTAPAWPPQPTWATNGASILYVDESQRLMRMPAAGGKPEAIGTFRGLAADLTLRHPSGSQIAYSITPGPELWRIDNISAVLNDAR
jgi:Tol biopolymer transport system component